MNSLPECLMAVLNGCETACDRGCCGLAAFSLEPIQLAASIAQNDHDEEFVTEVIKVRSALRMWKEHFGSANLGSVGYSSPSAELNWNFSASDVDEFADRLDHNLGVASDLIAESIKRKYFSTAEVQEKLQRVQEAEADRLKIGANLAPDKIIEMATKRIWKRNH